LELLQLLLSVINLGTSHYFSCIKEVLRINKVTGLFFDPVNAEIRIF
jgi:hypothetical protein